MPPAKKTKATKRARKESSSEEDEEAEPDKEEPSAMAQQGTCSSDSDDDVPLTRLRKKSLGGAIDSIVDTIVLAIDRYCYSALSLQCLYETCITSLCRLLVWCAPKGTWPPNTGLACGEGQSATAGSLDSRVLVGGAACLMCQGGQGALDQRRVARRCSSAAHSASALTGPHAECTEPPHTARLTRPS